MGKEPGKGSPRVRAARRSSLALVTLCLFLFSCGGSEMPGSPGTPATNARAAPVVLKVSGPGGVSTTVTVELATTEKERELGLMYRDTLAEDRGMLFLFATDQQGGFWMKNTRIPLTIAYLDASGRVLELHDGKPFDETSLLPSQPYRYALAVSQGWFARHGLGAGAAVELPGRLPVPE